MYPAHNQINIFVAKPKYLLVIFKQPNVYSGYTSRNPKAVVRNGTYDHFGILITDATKQLT